MRACGFRKTIICLAIIIGILAIVSFCIGVSKYNEGQIRIAVNLFIISILFCGGMIGAIIATKDTWGDKWWDQFDDKRNHFR